jgi:hypothetical protein
LTKTLNPKGASKPYQIVTRAATDSAAVIEQFCKANGRILLPLLDMIQSASQVVDNVVHEIGVKTLELILSLSAEQVAGPRTPGKARGENPALWFATGEHSARRPESAGEAAQVAAQDRRRSSRPRLRSVAQESGFKQVHAGCLNRSSSRLRPKGS